MTRKRLGILLTLIFVFSFGQFALARSINNAPRTAITRQERREERRERRRWRRRHNNRRWRHNRRRERREDRRENNGNRS